MLGDLVPGNWSEGLDLASWSESSGDSSATQFLIQQVSIDVQHGNVASVMATILCVILLFADITNALV